MIEIENIYTTKNKPRKCPNCGSKKVVNILYGPSYSYPQLRDEIQAGKVIVKPCCLKGPAPSWECRFCGMEMYREAKTEEEVMSLF